jgi:hypothetical protein
LCDVRVIGTDFLLAPGEDVAKHRLGRGFLFEGRQEYGLDAARVERHGE